jgi:hypothetical protein
VDDDRVGRPVGVLGPRQRAHLQPLLGEGGGGLIRGLGLGDGLQAHADAGLVHHHEHHLQAAVLLADQPAAGLLVLHHAGGVAVDAHLLFQAGAIDAVALARVAVRVRNELRHHEQADPAGPGRGALDAGQHQVDDVLGHVVLAAADPDLLAGDAVAAVGLRDGLGADQAEVRAAVRLGQVHGAAPLPGGELGQVELLLLVRAAHRDGRVGAMGQARIHAEGHVGPAHHLREGHVDHVRQALAAVGRLDAQRHPAALDELSIGVGEARGGLHRVVGAPGAAFLVPHPVQRREHLGGELPRPLKDLVQYVAGRVGKAGQVGVAVDVQDLAQHEGLVTEGRGVGHAGSGGPGAPGPHLSGVSGRVPDRAAGAAPGRSRPPAAAGRAGSRPVAFPSSRRPRAVRRWRCRCRRAAPRGRRCAP